MADRSAPSRAIRPSLWRTLAGALCPWLSRAERNAAALVGGLWACVGVLLILWVYGGVDTRSFITPDEASERQAAEIFSRSAEIRLELVAVDELGILSPRGWSSEGTVAEFVGPTAAPVIRGALLAVPFFGAALTLLPSAIGFAAIAASGAEAAPRRRVLSGVALPLVVFPATFWLVHYWMNLAVFIAAVAVATLLWLGWSKTAPPGRLYAAASSVALAAAIRPDFAFYTFLVALLATLVARPSRWRQALIVYISAGGLALALVFMFNLLATGDALSFGYIGQRAERADITGIERVPPAIDAARILLSPRGIPDLSVSALSIYRNFGILVGPLIIAGVFAVGTSIPAWRGQRLRVLGVGLVVLALLLFAIVRAGPNLNGAIDGPLTPRNSYARYMTPVYLILGVGVAAQMATLKRAKAGVGLLLISFAALVGSYYLLSPAVPDSLRAEHARTLRLEDRAEEIGSVVSPDSLILTCTADKTLWPVAHLGSVRDRIPTEVAEVVSSLVDRRFVYFTGVSTSDRLLVEDALHAEGLALVEFERISDLWVVTPLETAVRPQGRSIEPLCGRADVG